MGRVGISVLGPVAVEGGATISPRDRVVLVALAMHPGQAVSAERLADALWGERPPASWNKVIPGCVMRLRRTLGADRIETTPHGYRLTARLDDIDTTRFERMLGQGRQLVTLGEPERAAVVLGEALALWRGRALVDAERWEPAQVEAVRLEELRLDAEEVHLDASLQSGRCREILGQAQTSVMHAPLRERRWALLALAQYQAGRQCEALRTLHRARSVLANEVGVEPGPELVDLEDAILRHDAALMAESRRLDAGTVRPTRGVLAHEERRAWRRTLPAGAVVAIAIAALSSGRAGKP